MASSTLPADNPFASEWTTPFGLPPFEAIRPEHFRPAFEVALAEQRAEVDRIAAVTAAPTFENTVAALERSGRLLKRVSGVFSNLAGSNTNEALQAVEREMAPLLAKHRSAIFMNASLLAASMPCMRSATSST